MNCIQPGEAARTRWGTGSGWASGEARIANAGAEGARRGALKLSGKRTEDGPV